MRLIRQAFLASFHILLAACSNDSGGTAVATSATDDVVRLDGTASLPDGPAASFSDRIDIEADHGSYARNYHGTLTRIVFDLDLSRVDPARGHLFAPVGETEAGVVVLVDDYATRSGDGRARCEDGTETFIRVFSLPLARQLAAIPAGSCLDRIPRPQREATWLPPDRFRVETNPARTFAIHDTNAVVPVGAH